MGLFWNIFFLSLCDFFGGKDFFFWRVFKGFVGFFLVLFDYGLFEVFCWFFKCLFFDIIGGGLFFLWYEVESFELFVFLLGEYFGVDWIEFFFGLFCFCFMFLLFFEDIYVFFVFWLGFFLLLFIVFFWLDFGVLVLIGNWVNCCFDEFFWWNEVFLDEGIEDVFWWLFCIFVFCLLRFEGVFLMFLFDDWEDW